MTALGSLPPFAALNMKVRLGPKATVMENESGPIAAPCTFPIEGRIVRCAVVRARRSESPLSAPILLKNSAIRKSSQTIGTSFSKAGFWQLLFAEGSFFRITFCSFGCFQPNIEFFNRIGSNRTPQRRREMRCCRPLEVRFLSMPASNSQLQRRSSSRPSCRNVIGAAFVAHGPWTKPLPRQWRARWVLCADYRKVLSGIIHVIRNGLC